MWKKFKSWIKRILRIKSKSEIIRKKSIKLLIEEFETAEELDFFTKENLISYCKNLKKTNPNIVDVGVVVATMNNFVQLKIDLLDYFIICSYDTDHNLVSSLLIHCDKVDSAFYELLGQERKLILKVD